MMRSFLLLLCSVLLIASLIVLIWTIWPSSQQTIRLDVNFGEGALQRQSQLQIPKRIRLGQNVKAELIFTPISPEAELENDTALISAQLELPGFSIKPGSTQNQVFVTNQANVFDWEIQPTHSGSVLGSVPLTLIVFDDPDASPEKYLIAAQPVQTIVDDLLGLDQMALRIFSFLAILIGVFSLLLISRL